MRINFDTIFIISIMAFSVAMIPVSLYIGESLLLVLSILNVLIGSGCLLLERNNHYKPVKLNYDTKAAPRCKNVLKVNSKLFKH